MRIESRPERGIVVFDRDGLGALQSAVRDGVAEGPAGDALRIEGVQEAMRVTLDPTVEVRLVAAGPELRFEHNYWVGAELMAMTLALSEELQQLAVNTPAFLAVALVRAAKITTNLGPNGRDPIPCAASDIGHLVSPDVSTRCQQLDALGVTSAWELTVLIDHQPVAILRATDDDGGLRLYDDELERFDPISNREMYRIFSSLLMGVTADPDEVAFSR